MYELEATYQGGVLRLSRPIPLQENEIVVVTVSRKPTGLDAIAGLMTWAGDHEILRKMAEDVEFSALESS